MLVLAGKRLNSANATFRDICFYLAACLSLSPLLRSATKHATRNDTRRLSLSLYLSQAVDGGSLLARVLYGTMLWLLWDIVA